MLYAYNYHRPYHSRPELRDPKRQEYLRDRIALERGDLPAEEPESDYQIYVGDIRLASGRDPLGRFRRVRPRQAVVARGKRGEWDSVFLSPPVGQMGVVDDLCVGRRRRWPHRLPPPALISPHKPHLQT